MIQTKSSFTFTITLLIFLLGNFPKMIAGDNGYLFRSGTCVLKGQIKNVPTSELPVAFTIYLQNIFLQEEANVFVQVRPDGSFQENVSIPHSQFASSSYFNKKIFLMAGDTVQIACESNGNLEFIGNNVTAQVNRYYPLLRKKFCDSPVNYPKATDTNPIYEDFISSQYRLFEQISKDIDKSIPSDALPLSRKILKASILSIPLNHVLETRFNHTFTQYIKVTENEWITNDKYRPLNKKRFYKFLRKHEKELLDNPYLIMGGEAWIPFNRMTHSPDLFQLFGNTYDYRISPQDKIDCWNHLTEKDQLKLNQYAENFLLPQCYEPDFLKHAKELRADTLLTYADVIKRNYQDYLKQTRLHNNFALQVALCNRFNAYTTEDNLNIDYLTDRLNTLLPYITYPQVRFHLLQRYRQCIRAKETTETVGLEEDSVFQQIIRPYAGNALYIDFWDMGCGPCRAGMLNQREIVRKLEGKQVKFLYICNEGDSPRATAEAWMQKNQIQGEHIFISPYEWNYLQVHFQFSAIPFTLIINKKGKILEHPKHNLTAEYFEELANE